MMLAWPPLLLDLLALAGVLALLRAVVGRFIGLPLGSGRLALAWLFGALVGVWFRTRVQWAGGGSPGLKFGLLVLTVLMFVLVSELLVPQGRIPPLPGWWAALKRTLRQSRRSTQIMGILVRHGLNPLSARTRHSFQKPTRRQGQQLRAALEESGVTFVKLGQVLSTRSDLLPPEVTRELSQLQQQVKPAPWDDIRSVLERELDAPLEMVFGHIDPEPLAAASVGQVHRAALRSGRPVVVKVQRPGIREVVEGDLEIAEQLGQTLERRTDWGREMGAAQLAHSFADDLRQELDFSLEARNMTDLKAALERHPEAERLVVPGYEPTLSTSRVLVMEELRGRTLSDDALLASLSSAQRQAFARRIFHSILRQMTVDGLFHADPHPGNIMLLDAEPDAPEGSPAAERLAFLDCGSVGRIDRTMQAGLQQLIMGVEYSDPQLFTDALLDTLGRPEHIDEGRLRRVLGQFMVAQLRREGPMDVGLFNELLRLITSQGLHVPGELSTALRSLAVVQGTLSVLDPEFDLIGEARKIAARQLQDELLPHNLRRTLEQELVTVLPLLRRLPRHVDQVAGMVEEGRLGMNVRLFADRRDRVVVWQIMNQVLLTLLGTVLTLASVLLMTSRGGPQLTQSFTLYQVIGFNVGILSAILIFRVLIVIFKRDME
ncbi:ABC1 kinase family protein [Deinococcus fonticola]|uniref:ABC1 kinase family protein n=1 Tax=Deinococcus fonticola TaxID=2528713 RepID=UPI001074A1C3|nr:AarF/UbiB family protein [Deinococcus fonticola]